MSEKILNVLYQSNNYYAPITGVSLTSLLENNRHIEKINIYLLNDNINQENLDKMRQICEQYKRSFIIVETGKILQKLIDLKVAPFKGTYTTYFKLMAIKDLEIEGDRILQIDGDTVINGPLDELLELDLSENLIAATYDCTLAQYKEFIGIPITDKYYNCGVLLINHKKWIAQGCEEKIIDHLKNVRSGYYTVDQDILNVLFRKDFKYLDLKYNFNSGFYIFGIKPSLRIYNLKSDYYNTVEEIREAYKGPVIYHCMGAMTGRPWEENNIHPQNAIFDKYMAISPWKDFSKVKVKRQIIFRMQRMLFRIAPLFIYIPVHKFVHIRYFKKVNSDVLSN